MTTAGEEPRFSTDFYEHMRRVMDHLPSMVAYWDSDLRCRFANKAYKTWFGLTPEQIIGIHMMDLLGPRLYALNETYIRGALAGETQQFERIVPGPDGVQRHSMATYIPDVADGQVKGFMVQVTEITRLKETEAALRASEAFLDRTGRIARVGGWEVDLQTQRVTWSDETYRIFDMAPGTRLTRDEARRFIAPEVRSDMISAIEQGNARGCWDLEMPAITTQGRRIWIRVYGEVLYDNGTPIKSMGAIQDVSAQVHSRTELEREHALRVQLEQQTSELHRLLKERSDMLDVMAHEVRQPLNNASAALQSAMTALDPQANPSASLRVERAQKVMNQVLANIDNTLAVASLLARTAPIAREDTDIDTVIAVAIGDMPQDQRSRVQVQRLTTTRTAMMDMSLIRLALRNLLSNALKFSPPDQSVTLTVSDSDDPLAVVIDVQDRGGGIDDAVLPRLFERGVHARQPGQVGHGLGLYIVRRIMELHGGLVTLAANGPQGATFRLTIIQTPGG